MAGKKGYLLDHRGEWGWGEHRRVCASVRLSRREAPICFAEAPEPDTRGRPAAYSSKA